MTVPTPENAPSTRLFWAPSTLNPSMPRADEMTELTGFVVTNDGVTPSPQRREEIDTETGVIRTSWVLDDGTESPFGPVELALRRDLGPLRLRGHLAGTLVASTTALAQAMDRAPTDKIAGIGKELREHVKRIEEEAGDDDDTKNHRSDLSTPV